jgi:hypothetical protein
MIVPMAGGRRMFSSEFESKEPVEQSQSIFDSAEMDEEPVTRMEINEEPILPFWDSTDTL